MQGHDFLNLITKHLNANSQLFIHWNDLNGVTADSECAPLEGHIVSLVLNIYKATQQFVSLNLIANFESDHAIYIFLRGAKTVDARNGGNHNYIPTSKK